MLNIRLLLLVSSVILMVACGGNDGSSRPRNDIVVTCKSSEGAVFIDDICSPWQNISAYERLNKNPWTKSEITDGSSGNLITFSVVDSNDMDHRKVIDVIYADDRDYSASFRIQAPKVGDLNLIDMSEFAGGKLSFDIKVINWGIESPDLEFIIECTDYCGSSPKIIRPTVLGQWQTFEISVAEMIDRGLDISKVSSAFMLVPTINKQTGVHFQIDNVLWKKGEPAPATNEICYANHFAPPEDKAIILFEIKGETFEISDGQMLGMLNFNYSHLKITPDWALTKGIWLYGLSEPTFHEPQEEPMESKFGECSSKGVLSIDVFVDQALIDDGNFRFRVILIDSDDKVHSLSESDISISNFIPNDWNRVYVNLSEEDQISNMRYVGLRIDSFDVSDNLVGGFAIDNVLIKH